MESLQSVDMSPDEIDELYDTFTKRGIDIIDNGNDIGPDDDSISKMMKMILILTLAYLKV